MRQKRLSLLPSRHVSEYHSSRISGAATDISPGGGYRLPAHPNGFAKRRYDEDRPISANEPQMLEKILKTLNNIKSKV
jgi:hypothetical protein